MMKWGRKKLPSSSSSILPSIPHVLPFSWVSKFKRVSIDSEQKPGKEKRKGKQNSASMNSKESACSGGGRFYGGDGDGDGFWRLSFREENVDGKTSTGVLRSVLYDSDDELEVPPSSCQSCVSNSRRVMGKEEKKFSNMVSNTRKMRELSRDVEILPDMNTFKWEKQTVIKTPRMTIKKGRGLRKTSQKVMEEKRLEVERELHRAEGISTKSVEKDVLEVEREDSKLTAPDSRKHCYFSSTNSRKINLRTIEEDCVVSAQNLWETDGLSAEWQKLKEMKTEELKSRNEKQRKSVYISRELQRRRAKQNSKVRVYSPRTASKVEYCKIKAIEDMKKAKLKMKAAKERTVGKRTGLESFAVAKCSRDPQKDFRDSMIEMILDKRISQPEELEELLACYLTLNSDEYHDLIIKVFQQVWFDLNKVLFDVELQNEKC